MNLKTHPGNVLIRQEKGETTTPAGIVIPDEARATLYVVAYSHPDNWVKPGDHVVPQLKNCTKVRIGDEVLLACKAADIWAVIE